MRTLYFHPAVYSSFFFFFFLALSQRSEIGCLPYFHTWCGLSAHLECRSETCCARLAENTRHKKSPSGHHPTTLLRYIFAATKPCIHNRKKKLVKQQYLLHMSPQCGELRRLAAEIVSLVWGTPANFNGFHVLAALLHGTLGVSVSVEQRAPPIFGRAAITLGIGPHFWFVLVHFTSVAAAWMHIAHRRMWIKSDFNEGWQTAAEHGIETSVKMEQTFNMWTELDRQTDTPV